MKSLILSILLFSQITLAACPKSVTYLTQGSQAPCTGYLFSPEMEVDVRHKVETFDKLQLLVVKQDELINVMDKRLELQLSVNDNLRKQNEHLSQTSTLEKVIWFGLGAVLTGSIVHLTQGK